MPYPFAAARVTTQKIREARDFLEVPICVENVMEIYTGSIGFGCWTAFTRTTAESEALTSIFGDSDKFVAAPRSRLEGGTQELPYYQSFRGFFV